MMTQYCYQISNAPIHCCQRNISFKLLVLLTYMEGNFLGLEVKQDFVAHCQNHLCCHYNFPEDWSVVVASI